MQPQSGTYALVFISDSDQQIEVGSLGRLHLWPGFYVYVGSAFGPGGLKARIVHHMRISRKPHWHMDYLRPALTLEEIWFTYDCDHREHQWADVLAGSRSGTIPFSGFGASDCRCKSHLTFFDSRPSGASFRRRVHAIFNPHEKIFIKNLLTKRSE